MSLLMHVIVFFMELHHFDKQHLLFNAMNYHTNPSVHCRETVLVFNCAWLCLIHCMSPQVPPSHKTVLVSVHNQLSSIWGTSICIYQSSFNDKFLLNDQ